MNKLKCELCGKEISEWEYNMNSGLCYYCRNKNQIK